MINLSPTTYTYAENERVRAFLLDTVSEAYNFYRAKTYGRISPIPLKSHLMRCALF